MGHVVLARFNLTSLVGPLGIWELVRLARSGQATRARLLVLYLLAIAFMLMPILWFSDIDPLQVYLADDHSLSINEGAAFANRFAHVLLQAMLVGVTLMTPAYAAAAVAEEKERGTLELLLTTPLTDREIVLGKAVGRAGFVLASVGAGLPILALTLLYGGVDFKFLLAGCLLIASTTALAAAIGVYAACSTADLRAALLRAYSLTAVLIGGIPLVLFSPFSVLMLMELAELRDDWLPCIWGIGYSILQMIVAVVLLRSAIARLRFGPNPELSDPAVEVLPAEATTTSEPEVRQWSPDLSPPQRALLLPSPAPVLETFRLAPGLPPIDDTDPIGWKERHVTGRVIGGANSAGNSLALVFGGLGGLLMVVGSCILIERYADSLEPVGPLGSMTSSSKWDPGGQLLIDGSTLAAGAYLVPAAIGLAMTIARERNKRTLDALLTIPDERSFILGRKVWAAMRRGWGWLLAAVLAAGLSFSVDGGWKMGVAAVEFILAGVGLVVGLGAWLTVRCSSEIRAFRLLLPVVVLVVGTPVAAWNAIDSLQPTWHALGLATAAAVFALAGTRLWKSASLQLENGT